jgi:hypothetical protein
VMTMRSARPCSACWSRPGSQVCEGVHDASNISEPAYPHQTTLPGVWPANLCLPLPCHTPAGLASEEELLEFQQVFICDTAGGRCWFVCDGMSRCLLEGRHSDLQAWLRQYRGLAPPALPPLPPQQ